MTPDERALVAAVLADPADAACWLVYADWLDERGESVKSSFLRVAAASRALGTATDDRTLSEQWRFRQQLNRLRRSLCPSWHALFDEPDLENCELVFRFECPGNRGDLDRTDDPSVRSCGHCSRTVHYCATVEEAQAHIDQRRCVAVDSRCRRSHRDVSLTNRPLLALGLPLMIRRREMIRAANRDGSGIG